jgi:NTE family protein
MKEILDFKFQILDFRFQSKKILNFKIKDLRAMIWNFFALLILLFAFCFLPFKSFSQETPRKKIGLVLSGGGAKGFAHIGALKVIEKAGIKIDFIGGTSMGAVVGALYTSGYSANQIDSIFVATDFNNLITDYIPRSSKNFIEKRNDELYAFLLPFNNFKVSVPLSLSKGMYNYNILNRLLKNVRKINDFNKLPIPFVCMTTNIETGQQVVMDKGYLPQALLASSAFPTLFSPIEIDGQLLIDGGVVNNYPVEKVREMGADIIIGVDVQDDLKDRNSLKEATKILTQINNLQMIENMVGKRKLTDVYIKPNIKNYSIISFDKGRDIINEGENAANELMPELLKYATKTPSDNVQYQKQTSDNIFINDIQFNDLDNYTRAYIIGKLGFKPNSKITYEDLNIGIDKLTATQNFNSVGYKLIELENGKQNLILGLNEKTTKNFLKFSIHYDGLYKSAVLANLTRKKSLFKNDVVSLDLILGDNFRYNFDYYLDNGFYTSFGVKSKLNRFNRNIATDLSNGVSFAPLEINSLNINYTDLTNQVYVQTFFKQKYAISFGAEHRFLNIKSETLQNNNQNIENTDYLSLFGNLKFDSLDDKFFPTKGFYFTGDFQSYVSTNDFSKKINPYSVIKTDLIFAKRFYNKATIKLESEIGFNIGNRDIPFLNFVFGGYGFSPVNNIKPFFGYDFLSLTANSFLKNTATIDYEFYKKNHVNFAINQANIANNLFRNSSEISVPRFSGYAIGYGLQTIIGPIELKYSWSPETGKGYVWFNLGFWF